MYPYIELGFIELPTYLILFGIGYVLMTLWARIVGIEYGYDKRDILGVSIYAGVGLLIGAKLLYFVTIIPNIVTDIEELKIMWEIAPIRVIDYLFGGLVYYGGFIGAVVGACAYSRKHYLPYTPLMDIYAPLIPFVHAFGRVGCFMAGCCYGIEYEGFGSVHFQGEDMSRLPVQLIEAGLNLVIAIILEMMRRKKKTKPGQLFGMYIVYYTVIRFLLEFLRGDDVRGAIGFLSTSQIISIILLPIGIVLVWGKWLASKLHKAENN